MILLYVIRRDVLSRYFPGWEQNALAEPLEIAVLGTFIMTVSPLFIRLAWPTRSLPAGPLRRRLTRISERVGFRFTDVLVWDTGNMVVNACVTGTLPGFRYVLLTDALIESLTPHEIAAVFGHEIGHIAHRHLLYFGFFFMGSLGLLSVLGDMIARCGPWFRTVGLDDSVDAGDRERRGPGARAFGGPGAVFLDRFRAALTTVRASGRRLREQGGFL